ncbi:MAG: autoinducer binding domain-containing protein [Hyphomonadaceae bacterium]
MSEFVVIKEFVAAAQSATRLESLAADTEAAVREFGFSYYAILHHLDLQFPANGLVRFSNYPSSWVAAMKANRYFSEDPVLVASQKVANGFAWSDIPKILELSARQREILDLAARAGVANGYTVPIHVPGEYAGSCSFGVRPGRDVVAAHLPLIHYLACFAFEAARRIVRQRVVAPAKGLHLTGRQLDCLVLAGRGLPAREAAKWLGIKQDTFEKHIESAKLRAGVQTTTQLVVRGLFEGAVTFNDLLSERNLH